MEKKVVRKNLPVKELLFKKFKKSPINAFVIKHNNEHEKAIYNKVLSILKDKNYLSYTMNYHNIQIFLTDAGRKVVDNQEHWEID